jgi:hypothetical protein
MPKLWQAMRRADTTGSRGRGALLAALVGLAIDVALPLLPVYGDGQQFFWTGFPTRWIAAYLLNRWATGVVVVFGLVMLARHRSAVAAGVFAAIGALTALDVGAQFVQGGVPLDRWQTVLAVGLQTIEAATLVVAASMAMRRWS